MTSTKVLDSQKHTILLMTKALYNPTHRSKDYQKSKQRLVKPLKLVKSKETKSQCEENRTCYL